MVRGMESMTGLVVKLGEKLRRKDSRLGFFRYASGGKRNEESLESKDPILHGDVGSALTASNSINLGKALALNRWRH